MERLCQADNHNKPFTLVCTSPKCTNHRLFCFKCLESKHSKCLNYVLEIHDIEKRTLSSSINWVRSEDVKKAALAVEKYGLDTFEENFMKAFEDVADLEFGKLTEYFIAKIQESKKRVLESMHNRLASQKVQLKAFDEKLRGLYNFDAMLGILDQFQSGEKDMEGTSQDLNMFLEETYSKESHNKEVHAMAKKINALNEGFKELDVNVFENFKACIPFQMFAPEDKPKQELSQEKWTWDIKNISEEVVLSTDYLVAKKTAYYSGTKQPVLGSIVMANGHFQWEVDFSESSSHRPCFVNVAGYKTIIGIIDRGLLEDLDDVPLESIIGLSLSGKLINMEQVQQLDTYKKKKYMLDLDLIKGTFNISENGLALAVESFSLKGRQFVPIVVLFCVHDKPKLNVLHSIRDSSKEQVKSLNKMIKSSYL